MTPLYGHTSPETAYVVDDYPYGFHLRCKIRYWIETHPTKGYRFCSQTTNPKKAVEVWNAPKRSTYSALANCMYLDDKGHVQCAEFSTARAAESLLFVERFPKAAGLESAKQYTHLKIVHLKKMIVNGRSETAMKADSEELGIWRQVEEALERVGV